MEVLQLQYLSYCAKYNDFDNATVKIKYMFLCMLISLEDIANRTETDRRPQLAGTNDVHMPPLGNPLQKAGY